MSMQSVLGVVGGVVGSFFGYPQLGFMVGSLVGGLLTPKEKTEGPRLDDLKVQVSTYGAGIPLLYGTERIGGNVVWSTDKLEFATTTEVGKGGGAENTSYSYFVQMRIVLCETPRDGSTVSIVQIFKDGKLQWDARSGISVESALASEENLFAFFTLYQGHSDQLPDAIEEIYAGGPGTVPAYRGVVSIAMRAIDCPGGRIPQFSFVLSANATASNFIYEGSPATLQQQFVTASQITPGNTTVFGEAQPVGIYSIGQDYHTLITSASGDTTWSQKPVMGDTDVDMMCVRQFTGGGADTGNNVFVDTFGSVVKTIPVGTDCLCDGEVPTAWSKRGSNVIFSGRLNDRVKLFNWEGLTEIASVDVPGQELLVCTAGYAWVQTSTQLFAYSLTSSLALVATGTTPTSIGGPHRFISYGADDSVYFVLNSANHTEIWRATVNGASISFTEVADIVRADSSIPYPMQYPLLVKGQTLYGYTTQLSGGQAILTPFVIPFAQLSTAPVKVKDIIVDQCERAGETRYDVSGIPDGDTIHGYKIQNPASARANIEPMLTAFAVYIVDEDGLIKFKKYEDITSEATISNDELGQAEDGSEPADAMPLSRTQEIDLPRSVTVSYVEETFDYQTASETEQRQVTEANEDLTIELPMATNSDHAKKVAQMILFARWRAQNTRSLKVSRKFAFLSPGDGVTVEYPQGTFRLWRIMSLTDTGALIELTVEPGDSEIYTQTATGATGYVRQSVEGLAPPTRAQILDMPIVRDSDNDAGLYVAFDSYASVPAQAELLVGDTDANLEPRGTVSESSPIGFAETVLGNFTRTGFVDETNLVTINIGDDTFSSVTRDVLLTGGAQYWAYGAADRWEIGASAQANSLGSGRYTLSRHLRGLFGTERNTGNHAINDTFVLLRQAGILRPGSGVGAIGQAKSYRAVTKGRGIDSATSQTYANTGEGLKPLSPINLRRSNTNDLSVDRRSRLAMNNLTGALPLGEVSEAWSWEFYTSGTFVTLIGTAITTTATITAAQQTAIGVTPTATAFVRVRQISDSVGIGHELQATA